MQQLSLFDDLQVKKWSDFTIISRTKTMKKVQKWLELNHKQYDLNGFWTFLTKSEHQTGNTLVCFGTVHKLFIFPDGTKATNIVNQVHSIYFEPGKSDSSYINDVMQILKGWQDEKTN